MSLIQIDHLTFCYPSAFDPVFEDVSVSLDTDWKLGLVGRNGRGKTTLLRLLLGAYEYRGTITSSVRFDYFPYPVSDPNRFTEEILREICPAAEQWELLRELSYLDVSSDVLWRPFSTLSNGEQTKVLLAALFQNEGHFLLIDEPTNHLDAAARALVSQYLSRRKGFLLVSHDRRFLDGCVDHILSLNKTSITVQSGTYSSFRENFDRRQEHEREQNQHLKRDISRLREASRRTAVWSDRVEASKSGAADRGFVGHRAAKMMKRAKSIESRQQQAIAQKSALLRDAESAPPLSLSPLTHHAGTLAAFSDVCICRGGIPLGSPVSFSIGRGERILLRGKNGSGKSSLLRLLTGEQIPHTGTITCASGLILSYVPQDTSHLCGLLSAFADAHRVDESLFKAILRKLGFSRTQFGKDMRDFSAGQKKKVLLAKSLCEQAHLYVWDEPLNYIDIDSRIQIEQLIRTCQPSMLLVEHDRAFQEAAATRTVDLK